MQPRIYTYKITFEEVPYYYYGSKKERVFDEEYFGSPIANKWCWNFYTPRKQILELFDYTDEGYSQALEVEKRLIKSVYQTDKWCLNKNCGGKINLEICRKTGKKVALRNKENNIGIFSLKPEEIRNNASKGGKIGGKRTKELKKGIFALTKQEVYENTKKSHIVQKELGVGLFGLTKEQRVENGKKYGTIAGKKAYELGVGIFSMTVEEKRAAYEKGLGKKWMCTVTGFITNAGALSRYQSSRNIDKSNRIRLE